MTHDSHAVHLHDDDDITESFLFLSFAARHREGEQQKVE